MRIRCEIFAIVATLAWGGDAGADLVPNLLVNGDFGTGDFSGWTRAGNTNRAGVTNATAMGGFSPDSGGYQAYFGPVIGSGILSQAAATTPGAEYTLSFDLGVGRGRLNHFSVDVGGETLLDESHLAPTLGQYDSYSFTFAATSASEMIQFQFHDLPSYLYLKDVRFGPSGGGGAVPVPPSALLLGSGLVGLAASKARGFRRRRRASAA